MSGTLAILAGALLAGFVQGASGFAFALIATAIWVWLLEPAQLVPLVLICSLTSHLTSLRLLVRDKQASIPFALLAGGAAGVPIGMLLFSRIDVQGFKFAVGLILIFTCTAMLFAARLPALRSGSRRVEGLVGLASGVMGGLGGLSGPVPVVWSTLSRLDKHRQRATVQPLLMMVGMLTLAAHAATGGIGRDTLGLAALSAPLVVASSWAGKKAFDRMPDAAFRQVLLGLLLLTGLGLIGPALFG